MHSDETIEYVEAAGKTVKSVSLFRAEKYDYYIELCLDDGVVITLNVTCALKLRALVRQGCDENEKILHRYPKVVGLR
jgi:hypothetical protein